MVRRLAQTCGLCLRLVEATRNWGGATLEADIGKLDRDPQGQRAGKQQGQTMEDYVYDLGGHQISAHDGNTNLLRAELFGGGRHVATWNPSANYGPLFFNHEDWLGTHRVRTDFTGIAREWCSDTPYGMNLACTPGDTSPMHFTGKQRDSETGLDYFGARYFGGGNNLGRFMSRDPAVITKQKFTDPQQWNTYSYTRNNPLRFVDPTGRWIELIGTDEERKKQLDALQKAAGKAGSYLYDNYNKKSGKHFVGIYTNGPDGNGPSFRSINAVADKMGGIIQDTTRGATVQFVDPGTKILNTTLGASPGRSPGATPMTSTSATIFLTRGDVGSVPGDLLENGRDTPTDLSIVLMHELGHVDAGWYHGGPVLGNFGNPINGNGDAVRIENQVRLMEGLPPRNGERAPYDLPLSSMPY